MKRLISLQFLAFSALILSSFAARAEYYVVYPGTVYYTSSYSGCGTPCCRSSCYRRCHSCCRPRCYSCRPRCCRSACGYSGYYYETPPVVYMNYYSAPARPIYRGSDEVAQYAWVPYP